MTRYILLVLALFFLFPASVLAHWSMPRGNVTYDGLSDHVISGKPEIKWNKYVGNYYGTPIIDTSGNIYLTGQYELAAFDRDGNKKWSAPTDNPGTPVIAADGNIYFATTGCNPYLYSYDPQGNKRWAYDLRDNGGLCGWNNPSMLGLSQDKKTLYFGRKYASETLNAINLDGSFQWIQWLGYYYGPNGAPTVSPIDGTIYLGNDGYGIVFAYNSNGSQKWTRGLAVSGWTIYSSTPVVDSEGYIYVTSSGGTNEGLFSFSPSGAIRWSYRLPQGGYFGENAVSGQTIYEAEYSDGMTRLKAFNSQNGQMIWQWAPDNLIIDPNRNYMLTAPVVDKSGTIYTSYNQTFYAITPQGQTKWSIDFGSYINGFTIGGDDLIYIVQSNGYLTALGKQQTAKVPVILIPGIGGSEFKSNETFTSNIKDCSIAPAFTYSEDDIVWVNMAAAGLSLCDDYFDVLKLKNDGQTPEYPQIVLSGTIYQDSYREIIDSLIQSGYELNKTLYIFPYDWRKDIALTSNSLDQLIDQTIQQSGHPKVNIVAHSMGGLVAKQYISTQVQANKIQKLVTLGAPYLGSVKLLKALNYGDFFGKTYLAGLLSLKPEEVKDLSQNLTGAIEIMPGRSYYDFYDDTDQEHLKPFRDDGDVDKNGVAGSLNFDQFKQLLSNLGRNTNLINIAENFHNNLDAIWQNGTNNVEVSVIVGSGLPTLMQIREQNNYKINFGMDTGLEINKRDETIGNGDGTVPLYSASLTDLNKGLNLADQARIYYTNQEHGQLVSYGPAVNLVKNILDNKVETPLGISTTPYLLSGKQLSVHSPVNIHVYDEQGNHTGPTADGNFETNIPGSFYDTLGDSKYVWIPNDGKYNIKFEATDKGSFDFKIRSIKDDVNDLTIMYKDVPLTTSTKAETVYDTADPTPPTLQVDEDGNGSADTQVQATSNLTGTGAFDQTAPQTSIKLEGIKDNNNEYRSDVTVSLEAIDESSGSGILRTEYSLDDGQTIQVYSQPFTVSTEGSNQLVVKSIDKAGNEEIPQKMEIKIDKSPRAKLQTVKYRWGQPAPGYSYAKWPIFESWQQVLVQNSGPEDAHNVKVTLESVPPNVQIVKGELDLGTIDASQSAWSTELFQIKVDTTQKVDPCLGVTWKIEFDDVFGAHYVLPNIPEFPPGQVPGGCN